MATVYYPAIVERAGKGYSVFFPDLPGCTSAGATLQEAARAAEEALEGHLIVTAQAGEALPDPSELDTLERDPEVDEVARILVRGEKPGRSVRINITMDEGLVALIDRCSSNRSGFISEAARSVLTGSFSTVANAKGSSGKSRSVTTYIMRDGGGRFKDSTDKPRSGVRAKTVA